MKLLWRKEVAEELEAAAKFYRDRSQVVTRRFLERFSTTVKQIQQQPELGSHLGDQVRRRVTGFPFDVVYTQHAGQLVLIALAHHARRPGYWRDRTK